MKNTLDATSPKTEITQTFIDNFASPVSDFTELLQMAPGTFSVSPNGVGLGQSNTYFRGFSDGQYTMTYDGIPFEDTNSPTHHSWVFFPGQWIGGIDFDRSPGGASTIGPTNFGGSINLLSRDLPSDPNIRGTFSYGSFNTRLFDFGFDSGNFGGKDKKSSFTVDFHQMLSDGYQTYNYQKRVAGSGKYQYRLSDKTTLTFFIGMVNIWNNTPNAKGPTRAQIAQFGDAYLLSGNPADANYYGYNFYHVQSDFEYFGVKHDFGSGWKLDNKLYSYRYWNNQFYNGTTITTTSATDKLNGYLKFGDILSVSHESRLGLFRAGFWYEWAYTDRYQIPSNPITRLDTVLPNFHEHFLTQSFQPFAEYEFHITPRLNFTAGLKFAEYKMNLNQYADNGKTVGSLGGAQFVSHEAIYTSVLPAASAHYRLKSNWTAYFQYAAGSVIPPSSVFDTKNGAVLNTPSPTRTNTYQGGTTFKMSRVTLNADLFYIKFQNAYTSYTDPATGEPVYVLPGGSKTKGFEVESNVYLGAGFSLYLNGTVGKAEYTNSGLWVANTPANTEAAGITYQHKNFDLGFFDKRVGPMWQDNGTLNQAVNIEHFNLVNLFFNYTVRGESFLRGSKIRLSINNLLDSRNIIGITPASTKSNLPNAADVLLITPPRSFAITFTPAFAPNR
jgi:iron complex outermembrane receptor protein